MKHKKKRLICAFASFATAVACFGATDVYGNTIQYESDGTTVKYQFWSGPKAEDQSAVGASRAVCNSETAFDGRTRTWLTAIGRILSTPWSGLCIIFR